MSYADKVLKCRECGADFLFTAGEQEFYASRGLLNEPGRCPDCRASRKGRSGSYGGGGDRYGGGGDRYGGGGRGTREMHPAVCAECGAATQVPFLPRNDKPVYCSACFEKVRPRR